jgi:hypothetical protein
MMGKDLLTALSCSKVVQALCRRRLVALKTLTQFQCHQFSSSSSNLDCEDQVSKALHRRNHKDALLLIRKMNQQKIPLTDSLISKVYSKEVDPSVGFGVIDLMKESKLVLPSLTAAKDVQNWLKR